MTPFYAVFCAVCAAICILVIALTVVTLCVQFGTAGHTAYEKARRGKLYGIAQKFDAFLDGYGFLFCLSLFVTLSWLIGHYLPAIIVLCVLFCFVMLTRKDVKPVIPMFIMGIMLFKDLSVTDKPAFYLTLTPAALAIIVRFILYPPKKFQFGKLFAPLVCVSVALFSGGLLSPYLNDYLKGIGEIISVGVVMLAFYVFFFNCLENDGELITYVCASTVFAATAACLQLITQFAYVKIYELETSIESVHIGWSSFNGLGALFLIALPMCFYLLAKAKRKIIYAIFILLFFVGIAVSESDGSMAVALCFTPFMIFITAKTMKGRDRSKFLFYCAATISVIITAFLIIPGAVDYFSAKTYASFYNDSGRTKLYEDAAKLFLKYPLFGVGAGYYNDAAMNTTYYNYFNFHNTALNVAATMGVLGILAYTVYFAARIKIFADRKVPQAKFVFLAFLAFESYAAVDTGEFKAMPLLLILTIAACAMEKSKIKGGINPPLSSSFQDI